MAIYRGTGGAGDATNDATVTEVTQQAVNAANSATEAAASATTASTKASEASTSATTASTKASEASTSASNAATSATQAETAKTAAETANQLANIAKVNAQTAETNAETAQTAAETAQTAAETAKTAAETAKTNAATSATNAATSVTTATTKATEAATSATSAATSATTATTKATEASTSATNAAASATTASTKATEASTSATNAATSATNASTSETNAATSETNASTSATNAATSATNAATSATTATTKATEAATSATSASTSASTATTKASEASSSAASALTYKNSAEAAKDAALEALDNFDDRYLGQKASDPTVDNDGDALVAGALYFNTTDDTMKVYEGSTWVAAYASLSGALLADNNLSDISNASTARTNLGLGTAATTASTDYVAVTGDSMTGNLSFGDNDKAQFGAGNDLQIYHDGTHSYIKDAGTGNVIINGGDFRVNSADNTENMIAAASNGAVTLYHNALPKLATTSTGVDVTGTVTADGLTVEGASAGQVKVDASTGQYTQILMEQGGVANTGGDLIYDHTNDEMSLRSLAVGGINLKTSPTIGNAKTRLKADSNGDISFYEDTGTTPKFFWDASAERLGIGTNSPSTNLHVKSSGDTQLWLDRSATSVSNRIVSIGQNGGAYKDLRYDAGQHLFRNGTSEALRIDSSGNLLVGTTSTTGRTDASSGEGIALSAGSYGGFIGATRNSNNPLALNRLGTDGSIAQFRKDGSTVGSIGTANGYASIGSADTGILFNSNNEFIQPWNVSSNASRDAGISLGNSSNRFKDLYLSGGVYLGGTGSANHLDDYETGTFSASFYDAGLAASVGSATGYYVKVGDVVHINIFQNSNFPSSSPSGNLFIQGLPFVHSSSQRATGVIRSRKVGAGTMYRAEIVQGSDQITVYQDSSETQGATSSLLYTNGSTSERVSLTISYQVS